MKTNKLFLIIVSTLAIVLVIGLGVWAFMPPLSQTSTPSPTPSAISTAKEKFSVEQSIHFGTTDKPESLTVEAETGNTALDILTKTKQVETKAYDFGTLVESIEGVKNGTDNKYWIFSVNGQESKVGAGAYVLQPNDKVLWEFKAYEQ